MENPTTAEVHTTADYVRGLFESRTADVSEMFRAYAIDAPYEGEDAWEALAGLPLEVQRKTMYVISLGTGGPSDWLECVCTDNGGALELQSATYIAQWGSDRISTPLQETDALYRFAAWTIGQMEAN